MRWVQPTTGGGVVTNWYNNGEGWTIGSVVFLPGGPTGGGDPIGGNGAPDPVPTNWQLMSPALKQALADLAKPGCGDVVFAGGIAKGYDPGDVLQAIVDGTQHGSITFKDLGPGTGAVESGRVRVPILQSKKVEITINSKTFPGGVYWNNGDASVNAITLLHELGHAFNDLFGKGSSTIINDANWRGKVNQAAEDANANALKPWHN